MPGHKARPGLQIESYICLPRKYPIVVVDFIIDQEYIRLGHENLHGIIIDELDTGNTIAFKGRRLP